MNSKKNILPTEQNRIMFLQFCHSSSISLLMGALIVLRNSIQGLVPFTVQILFLSIFYLTYISRCAHIIGTGLEG